MLNKKSHSQPRIHTVWDPVLRSFHWLLVVSFFVSWWSEGHDIRIHIISGTSMLGLLVFRFIWAVIGDRHALFTAFFPSARSIRQHALELLHLKSGDYIAHTPIGSVMIIILLSSLCVIIGSGMALTGLQMGIGLFGSWPVTADFATELFLQDVHRWCFTLLQFLVAIHLAGVLVESLLQRRNLIMAMITGQKTMNKNKSSIHHP